VIALAAIPSELYNIRKISSSTYMWPKLTYATVAWSLCDSQPCNLYNTKMYVLK